jgi:hypothetical protein
MAKQFKLRARAGIGLVLMGIASVVVAIMMFLLWIYMQ